MIDRLTIIIVFLFIIGSPLFAIDVPVEPKSPTVTNPDSSSSSGGNGKKSNKQEKKFSIQTEVKLCDGRVVSGRLDLEKEDLRFVHKKDGIDYDKKLKVSEIRQIKILSWDMKRQKKTKDGTVFQMNPSRVTIISNGNESFSMKGLNETEFLSIRLHNENGTARLFSFWVDLQFDNGKWYSNLSVMSGNEREDCHPDVIRSFLFSPVSLILP